MISHYSALIVAAGRGERAGGGVAKQYRPLAGRPMLAWSLEAFATDSRCREVVIAIHPDNRPLAEEIVRTTALPVTLVEGGATRTASVRVGLDAVTGDRVLIHDAARPGLSRALVDRLLAALEAAPGAVPVLPVADALVREAADGLAPVDREGLFRIQTPQAFRTAALREAFAAAADRSFPDETALARAQGLAVVTVRGEERNFKVTYPEDFERMEQILAPGTAGLTVSGTGYDVHRLEAGDGITLCGVHIACPLKLIGHSDADAGLHAITDALLGASGNGDIGQHFPPTDDRWKGADSADFLRHAVTLAREAGAVPVHADVTLICERPKIGPYREAMRARVAELLELPLPRVYIEAATTEKLGFTGRGEGLAAEAIVTVRLP